LERLQVAYQADLRLESAGLVPAARAAAVDPTVDLRQNSLRREYGERR
jgi:hypothetical protein